MRKLFENTYHTLQDQINSLSETLHLCKDSILTPKVEPKPEKSFNMAKKMSKGLTNKLIQNLTKETTNLQDVVDSVK